MNYLYTCLSKIGLTRSDNEDSIGVFKLDYGLLAIVCDGLGGNQAGEVASRLTVETVSNNFLQSDEPNYLERIKDAVINANDLLIKKSIAEPELKGMATTVEVLFLNEEGAYWGHVGDSRIYSVMNGKLKQLTKDHSLVQKLIDEGFLTHKEAENHPNKNIIMRALGDEKEIDVDLSKLKFNSKEDALFFMCTDGVTNVLKDDEIEQVLSKNELSVSPDMLSGIIEERGAPDNFSFVIISKSE
jgi:protein phosphatase